MNTGIFSGGRITCYSPFRKQCDSTFEKKEKVEFVNLVSAPRHRKIILRKIKKAFN